jgi:hypothetical protein
MTDKLDGKRLGWGRWAAAALALLIVYPLSCGPEHLMAEKLDVNDEWVNPIITHSERSTLDRMLHNVRACSRNRPCVRSWVR